jgi:hypothetical protein
VKTSNLTWTYEVGTVYIAGPVEDNVTKKNAKAFRYKEANGKGVLLLD